MKSRNYLMSVFMFMLILILGMSCSKKTSEPETNIVAKPSFSPVAGTFESAQDVSISCSTTDALIRYTTNGSEPDQNSELYSIPINISTTTTIKAKGFKDGWTSSTTASATFTIESPPSEVILVQGGTFTMGDTRGVGYSGELPTHSVTLNAFYLGKYEVTQAEWIAIMGSNPSSILHGIGDNYPVNQVSWYTILKYCNLRSMVEGLSPVYTISGSTNPANWGTVPTSSNAIWDAAICNWSANGYRLPTEAEWEYAARGATNTPDYLYSGSDDVNDVAWYSGNSESTPHPIGSKAPNDLGFYDMSGSVWEWCWDWDGSYNSNPSNNPTGPTSGSNRILRGGGRVSDSGFCRVTMREEDDPDGYGSSLGFRLCRSVM